MKTQGPSRRPVRCAIYTRKSTEEGLDKEFTSLDAQRESAEAFIQSQHWTCLKTRYDDGGFTGGNMDRPALKRLLADIAQHRIDCVIVYKVDRLSRSLLDFARMMEAFEDHHVSFVSVTQQFNTATSMGRLVLNVLLSFAQFEREIISERTRDKIAAARRKGKWTGGMPLLGYDVDPRTSKLVVNEAEADRVRAIFKLYLKHRGLIPAVQELVRRGWKTKQWQTRKGAERGGAAFTKTNLHHLLSNVVYRGKVKHKKEAYRGEHVPIVPFDLWRPVQKLLRENGHARNGSIRQPSQALLQGLLYCRACGVRMTPTHSRKRGRRYSYYACLTALKRGRQSCPSGWVPASEIEQLVIDQLRQAARQHEPSQGNGPGHPRVLLEADKWSELPTEEQAEALHRLIERLDYNAEENQLSIVLRQPSNDKASSTDNYEEPDHDLACHD
jgi:site-specific DNA recombinase